jgi:hypothetical protein
MSYENQSPFNVAVNVHGLLLCWHLKNSQPGNRS